MTMSLRSASAATVDRSPPFVLYEDSMSRLAPIGRRLLVAGVLTALPLAKATADAEADKAAIAACLAAWPVGRDEKRSGNTSTTNRRKTCGLSNSISGSDSHPQGAHVFGATLASLPSPLP